MRGLRIVFVFSNWLCSLEYVKCKKVLQISSKYFLRQIFGLENRKSNKLHSLHRSLLHKINICLLLLCDIEKNICFIPKYLAKPSYTIPDNYSKTILDNLRQLSQTNIYLMIYYMPMINNRRQIITKRNASDFACPKN